MVSVNFLVFILNVYSTSRNLSHSSEMIQGISWCCSLFQVHVLTCITAAFLSFFSQLKRVLCSEFQITVTSQLQQRDYQSLALRTRIDEYKGRDSFCPVDQTRCGFTRNNRSYMAIQQFTCLKL